MNTAIIGYGKMGREIEKILLRRHHTVQLIIDRDNDGDLNPTALRGVDVAFEFTTPQTAFDNVLRCLDCGTAVVCGTTGWSERLDLARERCRERGGTMFYASNYALGVNLMFRLNRRLAALMQPFPQFAVEMQEVHHIHKKDAPSGTAITLAEGILAERRDKSGWVNRPTDDPSLVPIESVREGEVPGIHTVRYRSEDEVLELKHSILDRRALAQGAVVAGEFLCGRKGFYTMDDLIG